ncbi:MFS transporter [Nitrincola sp. MINF-07-Sa-05]|uniref:MFS transporter n=1 Tax=Nitrincola salilacus TaxID=3400273 RepID=UPI0039182825
MANSLPAAVRSGALSQPTLSYFLMFIAIGMVSGILGPSLTHLAEQTGSTMSQIALLFTARALGVMCGAVITGRLLDRFDGHRIILVMILLTLVSMLLVPLSPLLLMMLVIFVLGYAEVSINVGGNLMLMRCYRERSGPYISALHFCFGLGAMTVPLLVVWSLNLSGAVIWSFWAVALLLLMVGLMLFPQPSPSPPETQVAESEDKPVDLPLFLILLLMFSIYVGIEMTYAGWISTYAVLEGLSSSDSAYLVSVFWFSLSIGRLLAIPLLRTGRYMTILLGCFLLAVMMIISLIKGALSLFWITLLFGLSMSAIFPTLFTLGSLLLKLNGKLTGLIFLSCGVGAMVAPSLTGPLIDKFSAAAMPLLLLGMLLVMLLGVVALRLRTRFLYVENDRL